LLGLAIWDCLFLIHLLVIRLTESKGRHRNCQRTDYEDLFHWRTPFRKMVVGDHCQFESLCKHLAVFNECKAQATVSAEFLIR
jgi:hypothetical protein